MKRKNYFQSLSLVLLFVFIFGPALTFSKCSHELLSEALLSVENGKNVAVSSFSGNMHVLSWDRNEVSMKVYGSEDLKGKVNIGISDMNEGVKLECKVINPDENDNYNLDIEIIVPKEQNVSLKTPTGNLTAQNINGKLKLNTGGGNIEVKEIFDNIFAVTGGG